MKLPIVPAPAQEGGAGWFPYTEYQWFMPFLEILEPTDTVVL